MYRRPKFLETLLEIREALAAEADYDVDLFAEIVRSGKRPAKRVAKKATATADAPKKTRRRTLVTK